MIETGNRNFWIAQIFGWGLFAGMNFLVQYLSIEDPEVLRENRVWLIFNSGIAFVGGILLTTLYRYYLKSRSLNLLNFKVTLKYIFIGTVVLTSLFLLVITVVLLIIHDGRLITVLELVGNFFIFGVLLLIWNSIYFMIHYLHLWKDAESEKWKLVASMKEAQLGNLKSQINPHFIFNAINNIRALITENPDKAKDMLLNFSDLFRYSLVNSDQSLVSLRDEIEIVEKYFELLSIQFEEKLKYKITVDENLLDKEVPPMMIQLLAENAVKHGISELEEGGLVEVSVLSSDDLIHLAVKNTGRLDGQESLQEKLGVGLQNIRQRLQLLYGKAGRFDLKEEQGFVHALISYPLKTR